MLSSFRLIALLAALHVAGSHAVNVPLPISPPALSESLSRTLLSFSIEQDNWPDWSGSDARNDFTYEALTRLGDLTGQPPKLRVGANSEDHTVWSPADIINEDIFPAWTNTTPYQEATNITVGDRYYQLSQFLPRNTHMTWGVNFGYDNVTNAVNMAKAIMRAFRTSAVKASGVVLDHLEIGNEPNVLPYSGVRPANWTVQDYVIDWESIAGPVVEAAGIEGRDGPVTIQGAAFVITPFTANFTPSEIFNSGILESTPGKAISRISQHMYSAFYCESLSGPGGGSFGLVSFMDKYAVRGNLSAVAAEIAATRQRGLTYVFGETNSIACHGAPGVSNVAGIALWMIDYMLQAATMGISELYFHEGVGFKYNFFQPVTLTRSPIDGSTLDPPLAPHIQPAYYGGLVVNTFIGTTGSSKVAEIPLDDPNVTGYPAFEDDKLVRAVFVNLYGWVSGTNGTRPSVHIDLDFAQGSSKTSKSALNAFWSRKVTARRLVIDHADDTGNLTWAGQSYETSNVAPKGKFVTEEVKLSEGIDLRNTEAVIIEF